MNNPLSNCPFCGATADKLVQAFTQATDTFCFWSVECTGCGVEVADDASQEAADAAWNTRAPDAALLARVAELEGALRPFADAADDIEREYGERPPGQYQFPPLTMRRFTLPRATLTKEPTP